jgi:tripartite-type tricarboxylate transporter receptor subunit TctC
MQKHLPGSTFVVRNMPGAGNLLGANYIAASKPDGLTFGNVERGIPTLQVLGGEGVRYDVTKLGWLGSVTQEAYFLVLTAKSGVTNVSQLKEKEIKIGLLTPGDFSHNMVVVLRETLGWKLKSIFGYKGQSEVVLAMDRGEIDGSAISWSSIVTQKRDDLASRNFIPLVSVGVEQTDPLAAGAVRSDELYKNASEADRQLFALVEQPLSWSRSFAVPPGMDPKVLTGMRNALMVTAADPEFKAEADRLKFDVIPIDGEKVQQLITGYVNTPKATFDRLQKLVESDSGD